MEKLREQYIKEVIPALMKKFNYASVMEIPKIEKKIKPRLLEGNLGFIY